MAYKLNLGAGTHPLEGFENLDKATGWTFEQGLPYPDNSVEAITVSHALMYVKEAEWPKVFKEMYRALIDGGVVRITEDDTKNPQSERYGGYFDAVSMTSPENIAEQLAIAGFALNNGPTAYKDSSLIQSWHGEPPKVFSIEGIK